MFEKLIQMFPEAVQPYVMPVIVIAIVLQGLNTDKHKRIKIDK